MMSLLMRQAQEFNESEAKHDAGSASSPTLQAEQAAEPVADFCSKQMSRGQATAELKNDSRKC
jgi:hypothetical protein